MISHNFFFLFLSLASSWFSSFCIEIILPFLSLFVLAKFTLYLFCCLVCIFLWLSCSGNRSFKLLYCQKPNLTKTSIQQEFEFRLHCHMHIHHPPTHPPELSMLLLLLTAQPATGRDLCVQLYSHTQVSGTLHIWASNFVLFKIEGVRKF